MGQFISFAEKYGKIDESIKLSYVHYYVAGLVVE